MVYIDPRFKVPIYLDTNILVDYIDNTYPLLNKSIAIFQACPFIELRSSHYVRFEFVEIRKIILFSNKVLGRNPSKEEKENIKLTWKLGEYEYATYASDIEKQVMVELRYISEDLKIQFDDHVLHEQLIYPTSELILRTSLSREDSLVLTSSVFPKAESYLDFVVILTLDRQFCLASNSLPNDIIDLFSSHRTHMPHVMNAHCVQYVQNGTMLNLTTNIEDGTLHRVWNNIICSLIIEKNKSIYAGLTYKYGKKGVAAKCVYFKLNQETNTLNNSSSLCIIPRSLDTQIILKVNPHDFYWNNGTIIKELPAEIDDCRLSFLPENLSLEKLNVLRQKDGIVFYYDD